MIIFKSFNQLNKVLNYDDNVGFVPTMGSLHLGHISLIKKCNKICKKTLVSIFVNPTQFNKKTDFKNYPRNLKKDIKTLKKLDIDYLLVPNKKDVYKNKHSFNIKLDKKDKILCAKFRPGHFEGVLSVIYQYLKKIKIKNIFLGEKDLQQVILIKKFIKKKFKVNVISCKTVRYKNSCAFSSRNNLLSFKDLNIISNIAREIINLKKKKNKMNDLIPLIKYKLKNYNIKIEYLDIRNKFSLSKNYNKKNFKIFIAYYYKKIRFIDNF